MRWAGRLRTIPAMIRDKSRKTPAKDAPQNEVAQKAAKAPPAKASFRRERALIKRGVWPISALCEQLGVSASGFHQWKQRRASKKPIDCVTKLFSAVACAAWA